MCLLNNYPVDSEYYYGFISPIMGHMFIMGFSGIIQIIMWNKFIFILQDIYNPHLGNYFMLRSGVFQTLSYLSLGGILGPMAVFRDV